MAGCEVFGVGSFAYKVCLLTGGTVRENGGGGVFGAIAGATIGIPRAFFGGGGDMAIRRARTGGISSTGFESFEPTFGNGNGSAAPSGGAPAALCQLIGRASCSYADLIAAGLGWLIGSGGGSEPGSGGGGGGAPGEGFTPDVATCPDGSFSVMGKCVDLTPGGDVSGGGLVLSTGEAVLGRYGAALVPMRRTLEVARCLRGMVLGTDNLCYNRRDLRKDERKWAPGRKPLLTGGDLNAISRAARAAARVKVQQRRLEKLGLLKRPSRGGARGSRGVITKSEAARALRS